MKKILLFIFIPLLTFAVQYPHFSQKDFKKIEKSSGTISKNRANDYQEKVKIFKTYSKTKQLNSVNSYLNQLLPQYDDIIQSKKDYWTTPKEFLTIGYGDCEDYVIIKYFTLLKLGFPKDKLFFTTVYEQYTGGYHMVLSYFKEKNKSPLVLDNLSFRILNLQIRTDIKADIFINADGVYKIDKKHKLKKIARSHPLYKDLIRKVKKGI